MNFLNKFLSRKPDEDTREQESGMNESAENKDSGLSDDEAQLTKAASEVAEAIVAEAPAPAMPERPMYDASPYAGMGMPDPSMMQEFETAAGEALLPGAEVADDDAVIEAMRTVYDPEIPVNIYDLGLIYNFNITPTGDVFVDMSLTAPGCPVAGEMPGMVSNAVCQIDGIGVVTTKIVWEPAWTSDRMSEDAKLALGMM